MEPTTTTTILETIAAAFGVSVDALQGSRGTRVVTQARFAAAYVLARSAPALTLEQIGTALGGRHHTTIVHAVRQAEQLAMRDAAYAGLLVSALPNGRPAERGVRPL